MGDRENFFYKLVKKKLTNYFQFLGRLNRKELIEKISSSTSIIMPTLIGTYGLPYLEAQMLEKPVFTSKRNFSKEVCKDSAIYFDSLNLKNIADVLIKYSANLNLLKKKIHNSKKQFKKRIDWNESAKLINKIILKSL
jgi:glycosyltransferase involved in cell wall biosynthesis